jgi:hypothetical protein
MAQDFLEDYGKDFCILPWIHMATHTDGTALLCCTEATRRACKLKSYNSRWYME